MKLVTFGDSFVEGLIKLPEPNTKEEQKEICFPNQLLQSSKLITSLENKAMRGSSNEQISYEVYKYINQPVIDSVFLVVFSGILRRGFYDSHKDRYSQFDTNAPAPNLDYNYELIISGIEHMLEAKNISFLMINSFHNATYSSKNWINGKYTKNSLYDIIDEAYLQEGKSNSPLEHTGRNSKSKYIAPCFHPTAAGHKLIAKTLLPHIENLIRQAPKTSQN